MSINTTPWMEAIETQMDALRIVDLFVSKRDGDVGQGNWKTDQHLLRKATPFAWSKEVSQAVMQAGRSIPLDTPMTHWNLDTEIVWWYFEEPLPFVTIIDQTLLVRAINLGWVKVNKPYHGLGMPVCVWTDSASWTRERGYRVAPSQVFEWEKDITLGEMLERTREHHIARYGPTGPDHRQPQIGLDAFMIATEGIARFILAGLAWLGQTVLVTEPGHIERHRRKEFARRVRPLDHVRVVHLRRVAYPKKDTPEVDSGEKIEWSCRWVVTGHWRNQVCGPKRGDRKLTYILPYVKGPEDKPLRTAGPKTYVVDR